MYFPVYILNKTTERFLLREVYTSYDKLCSERLPKKHPFEVLVFGFKGNSSLNEIKESLSYQDIKYRPEQYRIVEE